MIDIPRSGSSRHADHNLTSYIGRSRERPITAPSAHRLLEWNDVDSNGGRTANVRFEPNWDGIQAADRQAIDAFNEKMQLVVDRLHQEYANEPVDRVRQALKTAWRQTAGKALPEPTLTSVATQISEGRRVVLRNAG
jgi:hypothetical protein